MDLIDRYDPHQPLQIDVPQDAAAAQRLLAKGIVEQGLLEISVE